MVETLPRRGLTEIPVQEIAPHSTLEVLKQYSILKIAPTSFFADYGCHVRILEETLALEKAGSKVTVCTYGSGRDIGGVEICRARSAPLSNGVRVGSSKRKVYFDAWLSLYALAASRRVKPDIVHAHLHEGALIGYPISRLNKTPLVFDFQGSLTSEMVDHSFLRRESLVYAPLRQIEMIINRLAGVIITSSRNAADILIREFDCPADKVFPVPDCVNGDRFRPKWEIPLHRRLQLKRELGIPEDRKIVVYLGLLAEYQGSSHLLQAASLVHREVPDVHFLLMGYPGEQRYKDLAGVLGISDFVTFTGKIPYEKASMYLSLGDVAVSPKISETEGNGKLLNYIATGLPTVTFNTPVSMEILGDLGVYAQLGNTEQLAGLIEWLLKDERAAEDIGRNLRARAVD
ncbi:MAG: glycosyltransferase family 4 protein, partial [Chloroflexi bacterium]|nr:glycosyltransferase family 4 protein [Chloroflexota bacterium]